MVWEKSLSELTFFSLTNIWLAHCWVRFLLASIFIMFQLVFLSFCDYMLDLHVICMLSTMKREVLGNKSLWSSSLIASKLSVLGLRWRIWVDMSWFKRNYCLKLRLLAWLLSSWFRLGAIKLIWHIEGQRPENSLLNLFKWEATWDKHVTGH